MMRQITNCPSLLTAGYDDYSPRAVKTLFGGHRATCHLDFTFDNDGEGLDSSMDLGAQPTDYAASTSNLSISGAQEKYPGVLDKGRIRIAQEGEDSMYIFKPAPLEHIHLRKQIPANEHLTMQLAAQVYGIETAQNGLCFDRNDQAVYITHRFDKNEDGQRFQLEDFASLIGRNEANSGDEFKYEGSYEDIARCIRQVIPAARIALERFLRLVVFNYIFGNGDAHLKNFSILRRGDDIQLAPAYDLINTAVHVSGDDLGLKQGLSPTLEKSDVYAQTGHPCRLDFLRFGLHIGLQEKRVQRILDEFMEFPTLVDELIEHSYFHEDKVRRTYRRIIEERKLRFIRVSN